MNNIKGEKRELNYRGVIAGPLTKESVNAITRIAEKDEEFGRDLATSAVCRILKDNDDADPAAVLELRNLNSKIGRALVRRVESKNGNGHKELMGIANLVDTNFCRLREKISLENDSRILNALGSLKRTITNETYRDALLAIAILKEYARSKGYSVLRDMEDKNGM